MEKISKKIASWTLLLLLACLTGSCDKKWPINGNLDGNWQLMTVETIADGSKTDCHRMYIGIQLHMVELKDLGGNGYESFFGEFSYDEDKEIAIMKNLKGKKSTSDNGQPANPEALKPYGLNSDQENIFKVIKADGKHLVLESDYARLTMRSF